MQGRPATAIAIDQGWLDPNRSLPPNEELEALVQSSCAQQPLQALVALMAALISTWMERGIQATTIHEALVERYGFTGAYDSVKRYIRRNKKAAPATVFLDHPRAETAQVNFGAGPVIIDVHTGEVMKTWLFVMTLTCSKHMYVELVTNLRVKTWLSCHSRAFEQFGGTTLKVGRRSVGIKALVHSDTRRRWAKAQGKDLYSKLRRSPLGEMPKLTEF